MIGFAERRLVRGAWVALFAALMVVPAGARLEIERLQRDIQLRYVHTTQSVEADGKIVFLAEIPRNDAHLLTWAPTPCSGLPPAYPPDRFYGEKLLPEEAQFLVEDMLLKFDLSRLWTYYVTASESYETTPVARPAFLDTPCTEDNYEAIFNNLRAFVDDLDTVRSRPAIGTAGGPLWHLAYELNMASRQERHEEYHAALRDTAYANTSSGGFPTSPYHPYPRYTGFVWEYREWPFVEDWQAYVNYYGIEFGEPSPEALHFTQLLFRRALSFGQPDFDPTTIRCVRTDVMAEIVPLGSGECYPSGFGPEDMGVLQHFATLGHGECSAAIETLQEDVPEFPDPVEGSGIRVEGWALNAEAVYSIIEVAYRPIADASQICATCLETPGEVASFDGMHFAIGLGGDRAGRLSGVLELDARDAVRTGVASLDRLRLRSMTDAVTPEHTDGRLSSVTAPQSRATLTQLPEPNTNFGFIAEFHVRPDRTSAFETDSARKVVVVQGVYDASVAEAWAAGDFSNPGERIDESVHVYEIASGAVVKHTTFSGPLMCAPPLGESVRGGTTVVEIGEDYAGRGVLARSGGSGLMLAGGVSLLDIQQAWGPTTIENENGAVNRDYLRQLEEDGTVTIWRWKSDAAFTPAEGTVETYAEYPWGWELARSEADPWGSPIWTEYAYHTDENENGYGKLKQVTHSDGRWERYEYTADGELHKTVSPFGDAPADADESLCRVRTTVSSRSGGEVTTLDVESVLGVEVSRSYTVRSPTQSRHVVCAAPGAAIDAAGNLTTVTVYEQDPDDDSPQTGRRVTRVERADGTLTLRVYPDAYSEIEWRGEPDAIGKAVVDGMRADIRRDDFGQVVHREVRDIASAILTDSETAVDFDAMGRPLAWRHLDGTERRVVMACCGGVESETARDGSKRFYRYDPEGRPVIVTYDNAEGVSIAERTVYDGAGRVTMRGYTDSEGAGLRPQDPAFYDHFTLLESFEHDPAGRLRSAANVLGGVTTHSLPAFVGLRRFKTTTYPDGGVVEEEFYADGRICRRTGTAAPHLAMEYGVEDGEVYSKSILLDDNGGSNLWVKSYTDFLGRTYKTTHSDGSWERTWFNDKGQAVKSVDRDGIVTLFAYNGKGEREVVALDRDGNDQIDYAGADRIVKTVAGFASAHSMNVRRTVTLVWDRDGVDAPRTNAIRDASLDGLQTWSMVDSQETHTVTAYVPAQTGRTDTTTYPDLTQLIATTVNGQIARHEWKDRNGLSLRTVEYEYGPFGDLVRRQDSQQGLAEFAYYAPGLLSVSTRRSRLDANDMQVVAYAYDSSMRVTGVTNADNSVTHTEYALNGQVRRRYGSGLYPVEYAYDAQSRMTNLLTWQNFAVSSGLARTTWVYNPADGYLARKEYDDGAAVDYTYTPAGRVATRTWARGVVTEYGYNPLGELTNVHYSASDTPDVAYAYDRLGRLLSATNAHAAYACAYTGNLLTSETVTAAGRTNVIQRNYDALNRSAGFQLDDALPVTYGYDDAGRLASVGFGAMTNVYTYGGDGLLAGRTIPGRLAVARTYDGFNRLASIANTTPGGAVSDYAYTHDVLGRRASMQTASGGAIAGTWQYRHDSLGQLADAWKTVGGVEAPGRRYGYQYDDIGNRTRASVSGGTTWVYQAGSLNQYTQIVATTQGRPSRPLGTVFVIDGTVRAPAGSAGGTVSQTVVPRYDADGNMLSDGRFFYAWDCENRLIAASNSAVAMSFAYDHAGRRIRKTVFDPADLVSPTSDISYLYDGWNMIQEVTHTPTPRYSVTNQYIWGLDLSGTLQSAGGIGGLLSVIRDPSSAVFLACMDANGNVVNLVDASDGSVAATYEYGPFGELLQSTGPAAAYNLWRFSTKYADPETGLLYYGYRYYRPTLGRWLSRDPIEEAGGVELYGFVENRPLQFLDPFGLAGYFFDGTGNHPYERSFDGSRNFMSNVRIMYEAYGENNGRKYYAFGVGTGYDAVGNAYLAKGRSRRITAEGATGDTMDSRTEWMMQMLETQLDAGDNVIDLFGFSRGAATALIFLNRVAERRRAGDHLYCKVKVRFAGLYDAVSSLRRVPGVLPSDDISSGRTRGFRFSLPSDLDYMNTPVHFVSLDEQRAQFQQIDIRGAIQIGFRGVHSDVGGGYGPQNPFSWLTLREMVTKAKQAGVAFDQEVLSRHTIFRGTDLFSRQIDPLARPSHNAQWYYNDNEQRSLPTDLMLDASVGQFTTPMLNRLGGR